MSIIHESKEKGRGTNRQKENQKKDRNKMWETFIEENSFLKQTENDRQTKRVMKKDKKLQKTYRQKQRQERKTLRD